MKKTVAFGKLLSLALVLLLSLGTLSACGDKNEQNAKTVVGTVDGNKIYYDEVYALASHYAPLAKALAGGDAAKEEQELDRLIRENIIVNTAMIRLCESVGLTYDESELDERVDAELTLLITEAFGGDSETAANIILFTSITCILTIPLMWSCYNLIF